MTFYSDPNFLNQLQGNPLHVQVGQDVYVKVFSATSDWTVKMRLHTCYMKPDPNAGDHLNFYIIIDGLEILKISNVFYINVLCHFIFMFYWTNLSINIVFDNTNLDMLGSMNTFLCVMLSSFKDT